MEISVVIPAYNEEETIKESVERVQKVLSRARKKFEIIIVDDGSSDSTGKIVTRLKRNYSNIIFLQNKSNMGKSYSLNRGFDISTGKVVVMMDADLQQVPEDIPLLLKKIDEGYDLVNGWRKERKDPLNKLIMSRMYNSLARFIFGTKIHDMNCGFKAIRKEVLDKIILRPGFFRYIAALAKLEGFKVSEVVVRHFKREHGKSKYGLERTLDSVDMVSIKMKSMFSNRPMLLFGTIGGIALVIGLISGIYLAYLKLWLNEPLSNHLPLLFFTTITIVGGIAMLSMGFLADMIKDLEYKISKRRS